MPISLTFLGAARTVTGSKYLLDTGKARVLIDAGLFQGLKELRELNWQDLPVPASSLDAIVLTHAHLDHVGYLPRIVMQGFSRARVLHRRHQGSVPHRAARFRTHPGRGRGQREPARVLAARSRRCRSTARPTPFAPSRCCSRSATSGRCRWPPGVEVDFMSAGHLLGSAYARVRVGGMTILFGGDLGRYDRPVLPDPVSVAQRRLPARRIHLWRPRARGRRRRRGPGGGDSRHRRTRRQADHPGLRHRARRGAALLDRPARRAEAHSGAAGLPRQPDGDGGAGALHRAASTSSIRSSSRRTRDEKAPHDEKAHEPHAEAPRPGGARTAAVRVLHHAVPHHRVERRVEAAHAVTHARHRHLLERNGDRRPGAASPEGRAAATRATPCCWSASRPRARAGGSSLDGSQSVKIHGQPVPVQAHIDHIGSMSAHADSTGDPALARAASRRLPKRTFLVHGEPHAMDAARRDDRREARLERPHAPAG